MLTKQVRYPKGTNNYFHQGAAMARTSTKRNIRNNLSVMASLPRQVTSEETLPYLERIFVSARAVRDSHECVNASYGRNLNGQLFIPPREYKNMVGWFRIAFRKKDGIVTNKIKNSIVKNCMLFIRNGVLHDESAVTGFVASQQWH